MDKMREEFEVWVKSVGGLTIKEDDGEYSFQHTRFAWQSWQASRAALCFKFPDPRETDSSGLECYEEHWREDIEDALNDIGVRYE